MATVEEGLQSQIRNIEATYGKPMDEWLTIVACHAEAPSWDATDWTQILLLYDALLCHLPSPVVRLHRAIALGRVLGPQAALDEIDTLAVDLDRYHLYYATRAELLRELACPAQARQADERAFGLTGNPAERALLEQRLA